MALGENMALENMALENMALGENMALEDIALEDMALEDMALTENTDLVEEMGMALVEGVKIRVLHGIEWVDLARILQSPVLALVPVGHLPGKTLWEGQRYFPLISKEKIQKKRRRGKKNTKAIGMEEMSLQEIFLTIKKEDIREQKSKCV